jgi:hypothetical protein
VTEAQVRRDDVVAAPLEPERDEPLRAQTVVAS